jgi:DNA-binding transcriptional LysR family regulator
MARACLPTSLCDGRGLELGPVPQGVPETLALYLVYHDRRHLPRRVRSFMDFLIAEFA